MDAIEDYIEQFIIGATFIMALIFMSTKELAITKETKYYRKLSQLLNVPILILAGLFFYLLVLKIIEIAHNN